MKYLDFVFAPNWLSAALVFAVDGSGAVVRILPSDRGKLGSRRDTVRLSWREVSTLSPSPLWRCGGFCPDLWVAVFASIFADSVNNEAMLTLKH